MRIFAPLGGAKENSLTTESAYLATTVICTITSHIQDLQKKITMSHGDPAKWNMPGWRIEQRYSPGVLIGNWSEERQNVS